MGMWRCEVQRERGGEQGKVDIGGGGARGGRKG